MEKQEGSLQLQIQELRQMLEQSSADLALKNRELEIEAALEKVRAVANAMQFSNDLLHVITIVGQQLENLGLQFDSTNFRTNVGKRDWDLWIYAKWLEAPRQWYVPYIDHPYFKTIEVEGEVSSMVFSKEERDSFNAYLSELGLIEIPSDAKMAASQKEHFDSSKGFAWSIALGKKVSLNIANGQAKPYTEEEKALLMRFTIAFEQAYTRFLDLQKAETQSREAQIELGLERVRARAMAMHHSDELAELVDTVFKELTRLHFSMNRCQISIMDTDGISMRNWMANPEIDKTPNSYLLTANNHPYFLAMEKAWKEKQPKWIYHLYGEEKTELVKYIFSETEFRNLPEMVKQGMIGTTDIYFNSSFQNFGNMQVDTLEPLSEENLDIVNRFAKVFDLSYTRFNDLQKAEAQAREAQIEVALERVRSRTLAMQKSEELAETAVELFRQLIGLGIAPNRLYIGIMQGETGDMEMWATDEDGTGIGKKFMFNKDDNISVKKLFEGWKAQLKSIVVDMQGKELEEYFHYLNNLLHIPFKGGLSQARRVQSVAYFSKGFIGMASPDGQGDQTIQLLERFAAVFNLTFTRFSDLKIAEAHAEQAATDLINLKEEKKRTEEALNELQATQTQLIQSEKMASLGELTAGIAHEIQNPLNFVNNFSEVSTELVEEMNEEIKKGNLEDAQQIAQDLKENLTKINHHGKRAGDIVRSMLQHSRSSSGQKELTDINALCDEYLRLAYHGLRAKDKSFNATFTTDFDSAVPKLEIIPQDIGRVILNLINNAFYAVSARLKLGTDQKYQPTVSVVTKNMDRSISISISDNGTGIPQKVIEKIFQPFFTTKPTGQGTGLGLSLSYDIVKAHGGELNVATTEGEGTIFTIHLPNHAS